MASTSAEVVQSPEVRAQAMKARIVSHMNADHADSVALYLRHYCGVKAPQASNAKLVDVSLNHMTIESRAGRNVVPFEPALKSFAESRERMIAMHNTALQGLGLSEVKITEFAAPHNFAQWFTFWVCILCYTTFPFPAKIAPGSGSWMNVAWSLGGLYPGLAELAASLAPTILPWMLLAHAAESGLIAYTRLRKHRVSFGSGVWWLWVSNTFVSGVACIRRFDELVKEKQQKLEEAKH